MTIVEHQADRVLPIADSVDVLVNGRVAYQNTAEALERDEFTQARLPGVMHDDAASVSEVRTA
ncbi:hypothetical protein [Paraburkholderia sp. SG-MS1]|uniref:hypothetical protein n=1 Tax=Paraburkholderia sp. SG-MS1 TaxID=2023741 RepID=UPI001EECE3A4|nr:hypothetical protein [Paraburkholderia sp. SG-MS1]